MHSNATHRRARQRMRRLAARVTSTMTTMTTHRVTNTTATSTSCRGCNGSSRAHASMPAARRASIRTRADAAAAAVHAHATTTSTRPWAGETYARGGADADERRANRPRPTSTSLLSVAPMMEYTTPHFRVMCRLMSAHTWLWTEMEVDQTLTHAIEDPGNRVDRFLDYPTETFGTVLQLGGSSPDILGSATRIAAPYGYDEINLNSGCPSPKVAGKGCFGAALMAEPELVGDCLAAMWENAPDGTPVSVKCRIGVDDADSYDALCEYVETITRRSPTKRFYVHARKALLDGLSPAENRTVPPLKHDWAYALARDFPECEFHLNGGLKTLNDVTNALERGPANGGRVYGAMIGRQAHADPWGLLSAADTTVFGADANPCANRREFLDKYAEYADETVGRFGTAKDGYRVPSVRHMMHPIQNLFHGCANNKTWRRLVDEELQKRAKLSETTVRSILDNTLSAISDEDLDSPPRAAGVDAFEVDRNWDLPSRGAGYLARNA
jgi:tRNA-dihydrouridine synthase A